LIQVDAETVLTKLFFPMIYEATPFRSRRGHESAVSLLENTALYRLRISALHRLTDGNSYVLLPSRDGDSYKDRSLKICKVAKRDEGASVTRELRGARRRRAIISEKVAATHTYTRTE